MSWDISQKLTGSSMQQFMQQRVKELYYKANAFQPLYRQLFLRHAATPFPLATNQLHSNPGNTGHSRISAISHYLCKRFVPCFFYFVLCFFNFVPCSLKFCSVFLHLVPCFFNFVQCFFNFVPCSLKFCSVFLHLVPCFFNFVQCFFNFFFVFL